MKHRTATRRRRAGSRAAAIAALLLLVSAAPASAASINASPSSVPAGGTVTLSGSAAGGCSPGDTVTLISKAFSHAQDFAGLPAITTHSGSGGQYSVSTQIPSDRAPGSYTISGRCGGGNLGVQESLQVTAGTLPRTGLTAWLLVGFGACLVAGGVALRRATAS